MVPYDEAIAVRGPMVAKFLRALLFQTDWGELDYLVVDMPPGTNDVHLTMTQEVQIHGVIIISTPQKVALIDVRRGIDMFTAVNVPVLGLIENMSFFQCDGCAKKHYIFGEGGVQQMSKELGVPLLGEVPFVPRIMSDTDVGKPPALRGDPDMEAAKPYYDIAEKIHCLMDELEKSRSMPDGGPDIVFER
jgi:ATP-binding protein involved in chromosome partitioning